MAVTGGGRATVAWLRREGRSGAGVVVSVHRPGHGWRTRGLTASGERAAGLRLTVSSAGAGVVWTYHRAGQWGVAARRWWPRKGWTAVRRTTALPAYGAWLAAGLDAAGRLTLTSARWDGPLRAVDLTRGGRWTAAERVGGPVRDTPVLVADPGGDVVVVWTDGRGDDSRLRAAVRPAGGSWVRRDLDPAGDPGVGPALAIDGRGRAVAVWSGGRDPERLQLHVREVVASAR